MPVITKPNLHFDATTYTGTGSSQLISNAGSFQPNFVWIKQRSSTNQHNLMDVLRTGLRLRTDATVADDDSSTLFSFASTGFNVLTNNASYNASAGTYVAWQWKAGGAAVANTSGSISSQVSVNSTAGFSVVTYTSPNTLVDETVGHGLSATPEFIITKNRDASWNWDIWHKNLSSGYGLVFATDAQTSGRWPTTTPTSSVFSVKYNYEHVSTNKFVAYCWTPIAGYSAFGTYTGNGSNDGAFIYTGFRPRWFLVKRTDSTGSWVLTDTSRSPINVTDQQLYPNLPNAESSDPPQGTWDMLSNGVKMRYNASNYNANGGTYIYAAFAESPFKYANAR